MKIKRYDNTDSRRVLTGMILDPIVVARISGKWPKQGLFSNRFENLIGMWAVKHFRKYGTPIGKEIVSVFDSWANDKGSNQQDTIDLIEHLLQYMSDKYEQDGERESSDYVIDLAGQLFNKVQLKQLSEAIEVDLERGDLEEAETRVANRNKVELGIGSVIKLGEDFEAWRRAFDNSQTKPLITYPGDLGIFFGNALSRDSFIAFTGSSKRGKSFWLLDLAYRGIRQRRRVAYFEAGDLSESQALLRFGERATRRPLRDVVVQYPIEYTDRLKGPKMESRELSAISAGDSLKAWNKVQRGRDKFRLSCHPNSSLSVDMVSSLIQDWSREEWVPDVVVIDYADILAPPQGVKEIREAINENWKHLRRISQEFHCLVVTATQGDTKSYDAPILRRSNFSDDRRKNDHVTGMVGINASEEDERVGVKRLNWLVRREQYYIESKQIWVAGCLDLAMPAIKSTF